MSRGGNDRRRRRERRTNAHDGAEVVAAYGVRVVEELLAGPWADSVERLLLRRSWSGQGADALRARAAEVGLAVEEVDEARLEALSEGGNHQGVAALARPPGPLPLERLVARAGAGPSVLLALDEVQDPQNLGAMLRTAAAFGVDGVITQERRAAGLSAGALRASAGYGWRVPMAQVTNLSRSFEPLKEAGYWMVGTAVGEPQATPLWSAELPGERLVLVVGGEHRGMRRLVRERCDLLVEVPMAPGVESLNVSVAAGVCLYELWRRGQERNEEAEERG